jgi:probable rRNA maturation factor
MNLSIAKEDGAWAAIQDLDGLAERAVAAALPKEMKAEVNLLFTGDDEVADLNRRWRGKDGPTNVLSFPAPRNFVPDEEALLGDIVLAAGVVAREAAEQSKSFADHTTHLIVHGVLHLLGFDHVNDDEAEAMEAREVAILHGLGISDPYQQ